MILEIRKPFEVAKVYLDATIKQKLELLETISRRKPSAETRAS